jgi:lipoprotein-releasing system permease protein
LQQIALFLVLGLIVLVSTFNVASTLVVLVRERMRDIGLLGALGLAPGSLRLIFLLYGGFLGGLGTLLGVAFGWGVSWVLTTFELIRFDSEVAAIYFIRSVPFRVEPEDLLAVVGFALLVTLLACLVPAWRAARIDPSSALRYE